MFDVWVSFVYVVDMSCLVDDDDDDSDDDYSEIVTVGACVDGGETYVVEWLVRWIDGLIYFNILYVDT